MKLCLFPYKRIFVVYDRNVAAFAGKIAGNNPSMAIDASESRKSIETVIGICRWLMSQNADRDALLLAVGGGVTSDLAGFAAGIYKRGIRYANVPTSLLAMVDASIGGKTGVNVDSFKNMVGVIRQPEFVYIYPKVLETLPARDFKSGVAELLKTFIINNKGGYYEKALALLKNSWMHHPEVSNPDAGEVVTTASLSIDPQSLENIIKSAADIKWKIVSKDEDDKGIRRTLNLGHTYGHAVEWWQRKNNVQNPYTHGEAVAIGIVAAARKSAAEGIADMSLPGRLAEDFSSCGLPVDLPCPESELDGAISQDKKMEGGKLNFVYIKAIGKVVVRKI